MVKERVEESAWELETGLIDNVDGYMSNCRFGQKDEYASAVAESMGGESSGGNQFLTDLVDVDGNLLGTQGWSIGSSDWQVAEDGKSIAHPTWENVVKSCQYGKLQARVIKELEVPMNEYGSPIEAETWDGLGFHWMQEEHETLKARKDGTKVATGLMPTEFLGMLGEEENAEAESTETPVEKPKTDKAPVGKAPVTTKKAPAGAKGSAEDALRKKLAMMAGSMDAVKDFQRAALKIAELADFGDLMNEVLDDGDEGFWAKNQG